MWTTERIADKPADVFEPATAARFVVLFLHPHGLETLKDREPTTRLLDELRLACVCPHGQRSWWVDRVCAEFDPQLTAEQHVLRNVLPFIHARWPGRSVGLFGISMGGQGALRLAFKYPDVFPVAAGVASALDFHERYGQGTPLDEMYDSKEQARQDTALLHIQQDRFPPHLWFAIDPADSAWYRGNDRLHEKLTALGIPHHADLTTEAGGHSWAYFDALTEPALRLIAAGLTQESRRLL